jgi:hypothetical protein
MTKTTEIVAWWGAALSTIMLLWDIYKWRTAGPKIRMSVTANMISINNPETDGKNLIRIDVTNYGDRPTTITNVLFLQYKSVWAHIFKKPHITYLIEQPSKAQPLPFELKEGQVWTGLATQDKTLEVAAKDNYLLCVAYLSHSERPMKRRILM